jgi:hypothetical protein
MRSLFAFKFSLRRYTAAGSYGECLCAPGFADDACMIECGSPLTVSTMEGEQFVGSRGTVNLTLAEPGIGLMAGL